MNALSLFRPKALLPSPRVARIILDVALAGTLFWGAHAAYRGSTGHIQNCDSLYSLVVAEKILTERTVDMSGCIPAAAAARQKMQGYDRGQDMPYQFIRRTDPRRPADPPRVYYGYPLGSTLLSLPLVEFFGPHRGLSTLHPDGRPNLAVEDLLQLRIAARVSGAIVVLFYVLCRFFCPPAVSALIAAGFAFGSPVWSTLSRAMWSHTWMVFCLSAAVVLLVLRRRVVQSRPPAERADDVPDPGVERAGWRTDLLFGAALGTAIFWMVFVRAQGIFSAAAIGAYLLLHYRRTLLVTVATGGLWSAALMAASLAYFGTPTPPTVYDPAAIDGHDVLNRFAWLMVSPSRGLLVYCPYVAAVGAVLVGWRKHLTDAGLLLPAGLAVAGHTALFSCYNGWHGGSSYGPRYFCDVLPWFVLATAVAALGLATAPVTGFPWRKVGAAGLLAACFGWGIFVHARGANSVKAWFWNARAVVVAHEDAVKDWRHPQFLAGLAFEVKLDGSIREHR
ncbi:MAG: hypothetical protein JWO38_8240 [Gemmataceae bacterium]|nr:hypothetical protein [Gemmataceae bacterium]